MAKIDKCDKIIPNKIMYEISLVDAFITGVLLNFKKIISTKKVSKSPKQATSAAIINSSQFSSSNGIRRHSKWSRNQL